MNVVAHLFLWGGILLGVVKGDPRPSVFNKWDDQAVCLIIAGALFALLDVVVTVWGWLH